MSTGKLYDLAETEVIVCTEGCEMCSGGWPQEAFEYVKKQKGLLLESEMSYDGDWLILLTEAIKGTSDELRYIPSGVN
jgi:MinD superfamily P-loop ATPase